MLMLREILTCLLHEFIRTNHMKFLIIKYVWPLKTAVLYGFISGVSNPHPAGYRQPGMAMHAAHHKIINLLKTIWDFFVWLRVAVYLMCGPETPKVWTPWIHPEFNTLLCPFLTRWFILSDLFAKSLQKGYSHTKSDKYLSFWNEFMIHVYKCNSLGF